ncbi:Hypothetical protein, putative [Bodo saltans]|uniref:Uncharacterized protein n=1 Tax=Bodo saltans TaxID=75058 RepID=A0A0S4J8F8_BODSA|nr:Hypothetical protein, putative [Bodo saltans]|eukprot:CUG86376.1 Hypothetical protein, putative [Bodo saltans]
MFSVHLSEFLVMSFEQYVFCRCATLILRKQHFYKDKRPTWLTTITTAMNSIRRLASPHSTVTSYFVGLADARVCRRAILLNSSQTQKNCVN